MYVIYRSVVPLSRKYAVVPIRNTADEGVVIFANVRLRALFIKPTSFYRVQRTRAVPPLTEISRIDHFREYDFAP